MLIRLTLLSFPVFAWFLWQASLPFNQYTFRIWEALYDDSLTSGPFYPNQKMQMIEVGDLAPYSFESVPKNVTWETDSEGYRNSNAPCDPSVIVLGDSTAMGASLSQEEMLSSQIEKTLGLCTRTYASSNLAHAVKDIYRLGLHPKWILIVFLERRAHDVVGFHELAMNDFQSIPQTGKTPDDFKKRFHILRTHFKKDVFWNYRSSHGVWNAFTRSFTSPEHALSFLAPGIHTHFHPHLLFAGATEKTENLSDSELRDMVSELNQVTRKFKSSGTRTLFTVIPNKETLYRELSPTPPPTFHNRFQAKASSFEFIYVDFIQQSLNTYSKQHQFLHHTDDSHWNAQGVSLLVEQLKPLLQAH